MELWQNKLVEEAGGNRVADVYLSHSRFSYMALATGRSGKDKRSGNVPRRTSLNCAKRLLGPRGPAGPREAMMSGEAIEV